MKKEAKEAVRKRLELDQRRIHDKLRQNIYAMRRLVEEQTQLKRDIAVLGELIKVLL